MIYVKDLQSMEAFYGRVLGLLPIEETRGANWIEFETGSVRLALHGVPPEVAKQIHLSSPPQPREDNPVKLIFEVADVPAECRRLQSVGVIIVQRPWGGYDGVDPEGNVFGLYPASKP